MSTEAKNGPLEEEYVDYEEEAGGEVADAAQDVKK